MKNHSHQCYAKGNNGRLSHFANGANVPHRRCRRSNAALSSSLKKGQPSERLLCFSAASLSRRRTSHFYRRVALKIMTRYDETRLAALRPFPRLIRPEDRYVYVCGNVATPVCYLQYPPKIFLHYAAIRHASFLLLLPSTEMKLSPLFREAKRHGAKTKKSEEKVNENEMVEDDSACGPTKNIK